MIDLEAEIRQTVYEWAEAAPMAPTREELGGAIVFVSTRRRRSTLLVATAVALVALAVGIIVVASRSDQTEVRSVPAPTRVSVGDVAGQTLAATYGLAGAPTGYRLGDEFFRNASLTAADDPLPTGPLGPLYAQSFARAQGDDPSCANQGGSCDAPIAVVTILPIEMDEVVLGAAGHSEGDAVRVGGNDAIYVEAWSASDSSVVAWREDDVAIVVAAPADLGEQGLVELAGRVERLDGVPTLPVIDGTYDPTHGPSAPSAWSLAPMPPVPYFTEDGLHVTAWVQLRDLGAVSRLLSTVVAHGEGGLGRTTVRAVGHPESGPSMSPGGVSSNLDGSIIWDASGSVSASTHPVSAASYDVVDGMAPTTVSRVRFTLSDGQVIEGPTYDVGRGWPTRIFVVAVPIIHGDNSSSGLHVVRMAAYGPDGELLNAGPSTLGNGPDGGMAGMELILPCHPADPAGFVFTEYCQGG
jgi:hypothetical protein